MHPPQGRPTAHTKAATCGFKESSEENPADTSPGGHRQPDIARGCSAWLTDVAMRGFSDRAGFPSKVLELCLDLAPRCVYVLGLTRWAAPSRNAKGAAIVGTCQYLTGIHTGNRLGVRERELPDAVCR